MEIKIGPNTEPCGIPQVTGVTEKEFGPAVSEKVLFVRKKSKPA
jgi:hypothetical protein